MIEIKEVKTCRQRREFLKFPLDMYKDNPYFVPPIWMDEKQIFSKDYIYNETCDTVYYNAYKDGKMAGRISGIIQKAANEKWGQKRVRFTRFDVIEDFEVAKELFNAVERWAISKGMEEACGPLGFSDLEREGLLIEGFDQLSTFEEQYNAPYYQTFIERLGYEKEVDWTESKLYLPTPEENDRLHRLSDHAFYKYNLHYAKARNVNEWIKIYGDTFFAMVDKCYDKIYGTVPFTDKMKKAMITNFKLIVKMKYVGAILDEDNNCVGFGLCFPSLAKALQPSQGHLTPLAICRVLRAIRRPEIIDLALIGVDPDWINTSVSAIVCARLADILSEPGVKHAETNLNLENNLPIQHLWKHFVREVHKRRRSYCKKLI